MWGPSLCSNASNCSMVSLKYRWNRSLSRWSSWTDRWYSLRCFLTLFILCTQRLRVGCKLCSKVAIPMNRHQLPSIARLCGRKVLMTLSGSGVQAVLLPLNGGGQTAISPPLDHGRNRAHTLTSWNGAGYANYVEHRKQMRPQQRLGGSEA